VGARINSSFTQSAFVALNPLNHPAHSVAVAFAFDVAAASFVVILSAAKDPDELHSPRPSGPFKPPFLQSQSPVLRHPESSFRPKLLASFASSAAEKSAFLLKLTRPPGRSYSFYYRCRCSDFSFAIFRPKIACQAQKPPNPLPTNNIQVAF
jgi:hypothetical protein